jgi:apolipoprotein D and lipocalin family protein
VQKVDLDRYQGRWYVVAHVPYLLEHGKVASYDEYARRPDGKLKNDFTFRRGDFQSKEQTWHGVAWVVDQKSQADWRVQFQWPFSVGYRVFELDADYQWAIVGTPNGKLLWFLSRSRQMSGALETKLRGLVQARGLDASKLKRVPQPLE